MLVATLPALDPSALLQFALAALLILFGAVLVVKRAASRYFVVDASFEGYEAPPRRAMSIGGGAQEADGACATCGKPGSKKCSRCKRVRYCSQVCQSKHWNADHKFNCKQPKTPDEVEIVSSGNGPCKKRKSSGFSSVSLVPARETCDVLREPKKILFPYDEFVELFNWGNPGFRPCGLVNCGNSCYANVVLQCLASTRPLLAYLLERDHSKNCIRKQEDWCFLCELQIHVQRASKSMNPFSPLNILSRLPNIGGNLGCGRQEDAHEFMRFAIDTMQSVCLGEHGGEKALDPSIQETTLIQYIFGGYLQSQVACTECNMISNRYENMMDLTVEIQGDAESIEKCLEQFTKKEWLDGENKYKCDGCNAYVKAWKRLTVHQPPNILTIALKRFQSGRFGKLNKRVTFPENLDLSPYMSGCSDGTEIYTLYAVVVHVDMLNASFFGHYVCYTKDFYGQWYRVDDCKVMKVEVEDVLSEGAYMLLYSRKSARRHPFTKPVKHSSINQLNDANSKVSSSIKIADAVSDSSLPCEKDAQVNPDELLVFNNDKENESVFSTFVNSPKVEDLTDMDVATPIIESEIPVQKALVDMDLDDPSLNSSVAKDSLGSPSISSCLNETTSGMANLLLDMPVISSVEVHTEKVQESSTSYDGDNGLGESGGSSKNEKSSYGSLPMADDSITNCGSSVLVPDTSLRNENKHQKPGSLDDPMHKSEYSEGTCSVSDSTIGGGTHIGNKATEALPSCSKNGTRRDSSEIFSRGFLNKPVRKKSLNSARKVEVGSHLVNNHLKENGFSNGHPKLVLENQVSSLDDGKDVCPDDMSLISHGVLQNPPLKASDNDSDISHCVPQNPPLEASDNKSKKEPNILEHSFGNHSNGSVTYTCNPLSENANTGLLTACYNGSTSGKDVS